MATTLELWDATSWSPPWSIRIACKNIIWGSKTCLNGLSLSSYIMTHTCMKMYLYGRYTCIESTLLLFPICLKSTFINGNKQNKVPNWRYRRHGLSFSFSLFVISLNCDKTLVNFIHICTFGADSLSLKYTH